MVDESEPGIVAADGLAAARGSVQLKQQHSTASAGVPTSQLQWVVYKVLVLAVCIDSNSC